jgi:hypothetical protein
MRQRVSRVLRQSSDSIGQTHSPFRGVSCPLSDGDLNTDHGVAPSPSRRAPRGPQTAWIFEIDRGAVPRLDRAAQRAVAELLADALVHDFSKDSAPSDALRTVPPGDSTVGDDEAA